MAASTQEAESMKSKILVAVNEGGESIYALSWAIDNLLLPCAADATILLLHVQSYPAAILGPVDPAVYITPEIVDIAKKQQEAISKHVLLQARTICEEKRIKSETMVARGDPRDAICEAVQQLNPKYLVVGSHGYGPIKRAFLGSVSDYCAHCAKCPVVIVKKKDE